ncbi:MAG TPA: SOS response-associated peptidase family protein, partial [Kofleriaceae bacterium]
IHPGDHRIVAFAGLWARAKTDAGELHSFTIITGKPNALVKPIHDRMPVVLEKSAWAAWLDPANADPMSLLGIPDVGDWIAEQVSTRVNKHVNDDAECIAPIT